MIGAFFAVSSSISQQSQKTAAERIFATNSFRFIRFTCVSGSKSEAAVELKRNVFCRAQYEPKSNPFAGPDTRVVVSLLYPKDELEVESVDSDAIPSTVADQYSWLITPKVAGTINYVVHYEVLRGKTEIADGSDDYALDVYENVFSPAWFDTHGFAGTIVASIVPLLIGLFTSRAGAKKE